MTKKHRSIFDEGIEYFKKYPTISSESQKYPKEIKTIVVPNEISPSENYEAGYFVAGILNEMINAKYSFDHVKYFLQLLADASSLEEALDKVVNWSK
ncbi:MAG: hypothetical protein AABZ14_07670 [Candidatus Margulisiibacteriota bacterium]